MVTPDMGLEGVIEDDEETKRKVVSRCCTLNLQRCKASQYDVQKVSAFNAALLLAWNGESSSSSSAEQ